MRGAAVCAKRARPRARTRGKLVTTIGEVFAADHAEFQHLLRRQIGPELRLEIAPGRRRQYIAVASLHLVTDDDNAAASGLLLVQ